MTIIICSTCDKKISIAKHQVEDYINQYGKTCNVCIKKLEKEEEKEMVTLKEIVKGSAGVI